MNNSEATKLVQTIFPYITKIFSLNDSLYFEGKSGNDRILVSKKDNQWILTINEICFITAQGEKTPEEITIAMLCIANGETVEPNNVN
jgi:hypothetical protein